MNGLIREIKRLAALTGHVKLMEVCGTHTVSIFRHGIRDVIPREISLISGPGCPVCVTSIKDVDTALALARTSGVTLVTFGDMMRVPGSAASLNDARAGGSDVRVVYSPMDALKIACDEKDKKVVFFATGFETTSPLIAATLSQAEKDNLRNFYIYSAHKLVPPALRLLVESPEVRINGFMLPGHVSTIIGSRPYEFISRDYKIPSVITGFDSGDILEGIYMLLRQIAERKPLVEIQYKAAVREEGNPKARALINRYFEPFDAYWRGIGVIPESGLHLKKEHRRFDAVREFGINVPEGVEPAACSCGEILLGIKSPDECPLFGKRCTPEEPVGACMVSEEGSCRAYYKYGRHG